MTNNSIYDRARTGMPRRPYEYTGSNIYISGRWPRRDGDSYGIVQAQPKISETVGPKIDANDPTGNLRPTVIGRDRY